MRRTSLGGRALLVAVAACLVAACGAPFTQAPAPAASAPPAAGATAAPAPPASVAPTVGATAAPPPQPVTTADPGGDDGEDKAELEVTTGADDDEVPEDAILFSRFSEPPHPVQEFDEGDVSGEVGSFEDNRFYELALHEPDRAVLAPISGLDPAEMTGIVIGVNAFEVGFEDATTPGAEYGLYCWGGAAQVGPAPRDGARYEMLLTPAKQLVVRRVEADGVTVTPLLEQPVGADPKRSNFFALLCRQEADGTATIGARIGDETFFVVDPAPLPVGDTVGFAARTAPGETRVPTFPTFDRLEVYRADDVDFAPTS